MPFPREASLRYDGDPGRAIDNEPELLSIFRKHTGLYAYRREYLLEFTKLLPTRLEQTEMLEQLRALENGAKIKVVDAAAPSIGVDTQDDLDRVRAWTRVFGMVNSATGFNQQPRVMNGFSDLILELFGPERGAHSRSAVGMAELPFDLPVEIEAELEIEP